MDITDLIDTHFMVSVPLWIMRDPDDRGNVAHVVVSQDSPAGMEILVALLFTDANLGEQCLAPNFPAGWKLGELTTVGDLVVYLHLARRAGLAHVAFDPGAMPHTYLITHVLKILAED